MDFKEFRVLSLLERVSRREGVRSLTQREIAYELNVSLGSVNKVMAALAAQGFVADGAITRGGVCALEPYRVKRAVFIAAGFGSRLVPITLNTPKPLVRVHGRRIIDSLLDAVADAGIEEIYIVRGYLGEQFDQLLRQHPSIRFIENPLYNEANNISSVFAAKDFLQDAYVIESDLLLSNPNLIERYQYQSNYLGIPVEYTDDWCFSSKRDVITSLHVGGTNCHQMVGISYWTEKDGAKLAEDVVKAFEMPGGKERYWDEVPLKYFKENYEVHIRPCAFDDIVEIDTYQELKRIDGAYV